MRISGRLRVYFIDIRFYNKRKKESNSKEKKVFPLDREFNSTPFSSPLSRICFVCEDGQIQYYISVAKMNSLKNVAAKVKHSPQVIRKTFAGSPSPYAKVTEGEKSKGTGKCFLKYGI